MPLPHRPIQALGLALLGSLVSAAPAAAQDTTWNHPNANWFVPGNWTNGVPTSGVTALINNGGVATISSGSAAAGNLMLANTGSGYLTMYGGTLTVAGASYVGWSNTAHLHVLNANFSAASLSVGVFYGVGTTSEFKVAGAATASVAGEVRVGNLGFGQLEVSAGGQFTSGQPGGAAYLGLQTGSTGTALVTGAGSRWTINEGLYVGGSSVAAGGTGTLTVANGGAVSSLGFRQWNGTVTLDGGSLTTSNYTRSGGTFHFHDGTLTAGGGTGGAFNWGSSTLTLNGNTSAKTPTLVLNNATPGGTFGDVYVGSTARGALTLQGGTDLAGSSAWIGIDAGSAGAATVSGAGTTWTNSNLVVVGNASTAGSTLTVQGGGQVTSFFGSVGRLAGGVGQANVTGANSRWANTSAMSVGEYGTGTLAVSGGGAVESTLIKIGEFSGSTGALTVSGANSRLTVGDFVTVGGNAGGAGGVGSLTVSAGGTASLGGTLKVWNTGTLTIDGGSVTTRNFDRVSGGVVNLHDGTLTVGGAGGGTFNWGNSTLSVSGNTAAKNPHLVLDNVGAVNLSPTVGDAANTQGQLTLSGGTQATSTSAVIGRNAGSTGVVNVTGATTVWSASAVYAGFSGSGSLNVTNGGRVTGAVGELGQFSGSSGHATIAGTNSAWNLTGNLIVGVGGNGSFSLNNGGTSQSATAYLAFSAGSSGSATVSGSSSQWTNSGAMYVGGSSTADGGSGTLYATSGGSISNGGLLKVWNTGTLTIDSGSVTTRSFERVSGGTVNVFGGRLTVGGGNGGAFNWGSSSLTLANVPTAAELYLNNALPSGSYTAVTLGSASETGVLRLYNGTDLTTATATVGRGSLTVDGAGSTLTVTGGVTLGGQNNASGALYVQNGATATVGSVTPSGTVNDHTQVGLTGAGSQLTVTGAFRLTSPGFEVLSVGAGTQLTTGQAQLSGVVVGQEARGVVSGTWQTTGISGLQLGSASAGSGRLTVNPGGVVTVADVITFTSGTGTLVVDRGTVTADGLLGTGAITLTNPTGQHALTLNTPTGMATFFSGAIGGTGSVRKTGGGMQQFLEASTYSGGTVVDGGALRVTNSTGSGTGTGAVTANSGGRLEGTGRIGGTVTVNSGGTLEPGSGGPGTLTLLSGVTLASGSTLQVELYGSVAGSGYDRLDVTGAVNLGGATLNRNLGYTPAAGHRLFIIANDGTDPVSGTFAGLPNGSSFTLGSTTAYIYYTGDLASGQLLGGNDVVISFTPVPEPAAVLGVAVAGLVVYHCLRRRRPAPVG